MTVSARSIDMSNHAAPRERERVCEREREREEERARERRKERARARERELGFFFFTMWGNVSKGAGLVGRGAVFQLGGGEGGVSERGK